MLWRSLQCLNVTKGSKEDERAWKMKESLCIRKFIGHAKWDLLSTRVTAEERETIRNILIENLKMRKFPEKMVSRILTSVPFGCFSQIDYWRWTSVFLVCSRNKTPKYARFNKDKKTCLIVFRSVWIY